MNARYPCAGAVVFDRAGRLLVVRRRNPPAAGTWSLPGGRCHAGEAAPAACVREVAEETGLVVSVVRFAGRVERDAPDGGTYVIDDFVCRVPGEAPAAPAEPTAGDDASDARWVDRTALADLELAPLVWDTLADWQLLPT